MHNDKANTEKLAKLIMDIDFAMMTTRDDDGTLRSRPMSTQKREFDGTLWFFTQASSAKVAEIEHEHQVNLSYSDPKANNFVSVSGTAVLVRDRSMIDELWSPALKAWFPKGKDDPETALLKVDVAKAEYWDMPSSKIVTLVGFAKALLTGKEYHPGDNEKLSDVHATA